MTDIPNSDKTHCQQSSPIIMQLFNSTEILEKDDLYELQNSFSSSASPFQYQMTPEEIEYLSFIKGKYSIADWISDNLSDNGVLTFDCPFELSKAIHNDGCYHKAVMLSDDTALQRLFFWLSNEIDE